MSQQPMTPLTEEVRFRVPLPIVIPLGALVLIGGLAFGMSRILLSVPKEVAVIVALAVAANVLIAGAVIAARPETARSSWAELFIVFTYPILIGIVLTQLNLGESHAVAEEAGAQGAEAPASEGPESAASVTTLSAAGVQFDTDQLTLTAGEEAELEFVNDDALQHNVSIYESEGGADLFTGDIIAPGGSTTYAIPPLDKGELYFQCDLHPTMAGTVTVE